MTLDIDDFDTYTPLWLDVLALVLILVLVSSSLLISPIASGTLVLMAV